MLRIVPSTHVYVIEKLGKFDRLITAGLNWIKFTERIVNKIDMRTQTLDTDKQSVITKDNVTMTIDAVVYFHVTDAHRATYKVNDYLKAMTYLIQTTLRNQIARMEMEEALSNKEEINKHLSVSLDESTDEWGVKVERVEIKDMTPPDDIREAMEKQMKAERERREQILRSQGAKEASITEAEGRKRSAILNAEAEKESSILKGEAEKEYHIRTAEGEAAAIEMRAQAEAKRLKYVLQALKEAEVDERVLTLKHIEALVEMAKGDNKVFVPYESNGMLGNLGTALEMMNKNNQPTQIQSKRED
ncbi:SPFH domain-containing protein [Bacillus tianshenii]|nr:SPFH domain-containing protein [Bacillus tianshenii]